MHKVFPAYIKWSLENLIHAARATAGYSENINWFISIKVNIVNFHVIPFSYEPEGTWLVTTLPCHIRYLSSVTKVTTNLKQKQLFLHKVNSGASSEYHSTKPVLGVTTIQRKYCHSLIRDDLT